MANPLTDEQQGGTAPQPGAVATAEQAPEETVTAIAADDPATVAEATPTAEASPTAEAIADTMRVATAGDYEQSLAKLNLSQRQVPIVVRLPESARDDLSQLVADKAYEFLFVWSPLKMKGATGSPGNPMALY